jgi:hypothetical protein
MTLQELAQTGAAIGGVGVIASFIYVAIQIRNNTRAVRAATFQQLVSSLVGQLDELARDGELCSLVLRGGDDFETLDRIEKARFRFHLLSHLRRVENAYVQHEIGTLKDQYWIGIREGLSAIFSSPGQRAAWILIKSRLNPEFRNFVDEIVSKATTQPLKL